MQPADTWAGSLALYGNALQAANRSPGTIRLHRHYLAQLREQHARPWRVSTEDLQRLMASRAVGRFGPQVGPYGVPRVLSVGPRVRADRARSGCVAGNGARPGRCCPSDPGARRAAAAPGAG